MNPFVFRLARLLKLRKLTERQQARVLGDALLDEERDRHVVQEQTLLRDSVRQTVAESIHGPAPAGLLARLSEAVEALSATVEEATLAHQKTAERVHDERQHYQTSRRKRRVLERLRDRRKNEWMAEANRHEQAELDELAARVVRPHDGDSQ